MGKPQKTELPLKLALKLLLQYLLGCPFFKFPFLKLPVEFRLEILLELP